MKKLGIRRRSMHQKSEIYFEKKNMNLHQIQLLILGYDDRKLQLHCPDMGQINLKIYYAALLEARI